MTLYVLQDEVIKEEVARCEQNVKDGKFRLGDLLAVPMQRILKYHLLLRELLQHTPQVGHVCTFLRSTDPLFKLSTRMYYK